MQLQAKAIILARVSSKAQEDEGYSLDSQLKLLRQYCKKKRLIIEKEFKIAETASKDQRRIVFREMLGYLRKQKVFHLVVEKTDRLTRNLRDAVSMDDWLEGDDRRMLHMVKENLLLHKGARSDTKLMWSIYLSFAKKYTDGLREEAMKGWAEKLAQGWLPAPPPPGYMTVTDRSKRIHIPSPATRPIVQRCFALYVLPDQTVKSVAEEAERLGLTTKKGRPLSKSAVHKMLDNPFYIGINRHDGKEYPGAQEPIIDLELFNAVQKKMHAGRAPRRRKHNPIFNGMLRCIHCGYLVSWQLQKKYYYGSCQKRVEACKYRKMLRQDRVEQQVIGELETIKDPDGKILKKIEDALDLNSPKGISHQAMLIESLHRQLARLSHMEDKLYEDKLSGAISEKRYSAKCQQFAEQAAKAQEQLAKLQEAKAEEPAAPEPESDNPLVRLYMKSSPNQKRIIMANAFKKMTADGDSVSFKLTI